MASAYDKASLVMLPHATKDGKLYSVKPEDRSGDFTFSRGTDTATRVNSSGLIEKERSNQILQSNSFDTTWINASTSEASGQADRNGGTDAWLLAKAGAGGYIYQAVSASGVFTQSIYAKAGTINWIRISNSGISSAIAYYDLSNGVVGTTLSGVVDASIEDVGSGWYRCVLVLNGTSGAIRIFPANGDNDVSGSSGNIYIQDAMLNEGLVAQPYIETTTAAVYEGITDNLPRLDYSGGASCPSLLLEPSRTNIVSHSEYFSLGSGYWGNTRCSIESNSIISPEGLVNASKLLQNPATTNAGLINATITASGSNTFSFYARKGTKDFARLSLYSSVETSAYFDLENGEIGTTNLIAEADCFIEDMGNDWYRCGATYSGATNRFNIYIADRDGQTTLLDASNAYIYIYGAQWEASASYVSSYIPTYGASASRAADGTQINPTSFLSADEGSWYVDLKNLEFSIKGTSLPTYFLGDSDSRCIGFIARAVGSDTIQICKREGASAIELYTTPTNAAKVCFTWNGSNLKVFVDGVKQYDDNSFANFTNWDVLIFNYSSRAALIEMNQNTLFPTQLTDAEAIALTA